MPQSESKSGFWLARISVLLICLCLIGATPAGAHTKAQTTAFKKADFCQKKLFRSLKAKRYRHQWEKCIRLYSHFLKQKGSRSSKEPGYYHLSELYLGLARFSGRSGDLKVADKKVQGFKKRYPNSRYVKKLYQQLSLLKNNHPRQKTQKMVVKARVKEMRYWSYPQYTRVVFDLTGPVDYRERERSDPKRLVILLEHAGLPRGLGNQVLRVEDGVIKRVRAVQHTPDSVQASLDLGDISHYRISTLTNPDRVVVDLYSRVPDTRASKTNAIRKPVSKGLKTVSSSIEKIRRIVIDPGHGGKDPGAVGYKGLTEKEVVLDIALRLKKLITKNTDLEVLMTRQRDVFIPLKKRTVFANEKRGNLFISIHVNAEPTRRARGMEIYTLGQATDPRALATAARENSLQKEALKSLEGVARVMLTDLSTTRRQDQSLELAHATHLSFNKTMGAKYNLIDLGVKQAPFYILMNADMPSILAEVSFISNRAEGKRLATRSYRQRIALSLYEGIRSYIRNSRPDLRVGKLKVAK